MQECFDLLLARGFMCLQENSISWMVDMQIHHLFLPHTEEFYIGILLAFFGSGSVATGDLNFVSVPQVENTSNHVSFIEIDAPDGGLNPFSSATLDDQAATSTNHGAEEFEPKTSARSGQKGEGSVKRRKQSQVAVVLEDYLDFRKKQSRKFAEEMKEAPKEDDKYSIANCVATLEAMEELTDLQKGKALRLFKCPLNRELFINSKVPSVRLYWLKEEINASEKA